MKLSIVIVNWNTLELTKQCLESIFLSSDKLPQYEIETIVIDNGSTDLSFRYLKSLGNRINLILNDSNLGYAFACNQGMQRAEGDYVLLLGSDTIINEEALSECIEFIDGNEKCGAVSCKVLNPDGTVQNNVKKFPLLKNAFYTYLSLNFLNKDYDMDWFHYDNIQEVEQIATTFLMVRNKILKEINYFDLKYRILYNDVDLCKKINHKGYKVYFIPDASIIHHGSQSTKQASYHIRLIMYKDIYRYYKRNFGFMAMFLVPILYIRLTLIKYIK